MVNITDNAEAFAEQIKTRTKYDNKQDGGSVILFHEDVMVVLDVVRSVARLEDPQRKARGVGRAYE